MKLKFPTKNNSQLQLFAQKIYNLLVDNFEQTFFVGGMVRDLLLKKRVTDIDIATNATPEEIIKILEPNKIKFDAKDINFGVIVAKNSPYSVEIATFRKEIYKNSRYPNINFIKEAKADSERRDFTVNALYLSPKTNIILDFNNGLRDIKTKKLKFIGGPKKRIEQDPLRILRALRFALDLNFGLDHKTKKAIEKNLFRLKYLTKSRTEKEILKIKNKNNKNFVLKILTAQKPLDTFRKKF